MNWKPTVIGVIALAVLSPLAQAQDAHDTGVAIHEIVAALDDNDLSANELRAIATFSRVDIVDLAMLEEDPDFVLIEQALARTQDGWAMIQTAIVANEVLRQELRQRSIPIRVIAAATMDDEEVVTIYIR